MSSPAQNPFPNNPPAVQTGASAAALSNREVAEIQGMIVMAKRYPRDQRESMDRILNACTRLSLAESAMYQYARGGTDVVGPSIRLAEELARGWGNILSGITELSRSDGMSECLAYCWDLESNYRDEKRFQVKHWRDTKNGGYKLTDERDIYEMVANQGARRKRACVLAVIPGDVVEAAVKQCENTLFAKVEVTPERIESMVKKFAEYGVTKDLIEKRIQRRLDTITPALFLNLGKIYTSIKDGISSPPDWFDVQRPSGNGSGSTTLSDLKGQQQPPQAAPEEPPPAEPHPEELPPDEPPKPTTADAPATPDELRTMIKNAKGADDLDAALDLVRSLPEGDERSALRAAAMERFREFA